MSAKLFISLDQNVISLLEPTAQAVPPEWAKIKSLLLTGVSDGKIICPIPHETAWESIPLSEDRYQRIKKLQTDLSLGLSFKSYVHLLSEEVLALVRTDVNLNPFESGNWHNLCDKLRSPAAQDWYLKMKENIAATMNALPVSYENKQLTAVKLNQLIHKKESLDLYNNLELLKTGQTLTPTCAYTFDICEFLQKNNISPDEIERLKQLVLQDKYKAIPIHYHYNRLVTQFQFDLLHGGRKEKIGDLYDLPRAATALWGAQIYICDAEMATVCKKAKNSELQTVPTIIISTRQPDLFLQHLELILQ